MTMPLVFALESLAIRLRKKVPLDEWKLKWGHDDQRPSATL